MGTKTQTTDRETSSPESEVGSASPHKESGAQNRLGNEEIKQRLQNQGMGGECGDVRLPASIPAVGKVGYYRARHNDFADRYQFCHLKPPVYYIEYGEKYAQRFTFETDKRLTPDGQAWLFRARVFLQKAIEDERDRDPVAFDRLERDDAAFTRFAYDTHPDAYWDAGLADLDVFDLANVGLTPNARDLFGWDGVVQVADITARLGGAWGADGIDYIYGEGSAEDAMDGLVIAYGELGKGIDDVFGAGTARILEDTAIATGEDLVNIGQSLHGSASEVVEFGVNASDSVFGAGATEAAIDNVGTVLNDGTDWFEERVTIAKKWFDSL